MEPEPAFHWIGRKVMRFVRGPSCSRSFYVHYKAAHSNSKKLKEQSIRKELIHFFVEDNPIAAYDQRLVWNGDWNKWYSISPRMKNNIRTPKEILHSTYRTMIFKLKDGSERKAWRRSMGRYLRSTLVQSIDGVISQFWWSVRYKFWCWVSTIVGCRKKRKANVDILASVTLL